MSFLLVTMLHLLAPDDPRRAVLRFYSADQLDRLFSIPTWAYERG